MFYAELVFRWLHIFGAIILMGGTIFMRFGYSPAASQLSDEDRQKVQEAMIGQWRKWVMMAAGFLLISGICNTGMIHMKFKLPTLYNALLVIKALLALGVFFVSSRLVGRSEAAGEMRKDLRRWLNINLTMAFAIVAMAGVMKLSDHAPKDKEKKEPVKTTQVIEQTMEGDGWIKKPKRS